MLTLERELCKAYRAARIAFDLDPFSAPKLMAFEGATADLIAFIRAEGGAPAEDWAHYVRFELDRHGELQEMPLCYDRFASWALHGAASVAPAFGRTA